jgi:hypothetical protein
MRADANAITAGFQRLNPRFKRMTIWNNEKHEHFRKKNDEKCMSKSSYLRITAQYLQYARSFEPYYFFITLVFRRCTSFYEKCQYTNNLLFMLNRRKFTDRFKSRNHFLDGFAIFEDHPSRAFDADDKTHIHLLIKKHEKFDGKNFEEHKAEFYKVARKVKDRNGKSVFNEDYIDFRKPGDERSGYCMADIDDNNVCNFKFLCVEGLSDNLPIY